jgi:hypothetical protein
MIDMQGLATEITQLVAPFLPVLAATGEAFAEGMVEKAGDQTFDFVKDKIWKKLWPQLADNAKASLAIEQLAGSPQSADYQRSFANILLPILKSDTQLAKELASQLKSDSFQQVIAEAGSVVDNISQSSSGAGTTKQKVLAKNKSKITGVHQHRK